MIKLENVSKYYNTENLVALALHKINLQLTLGEFIAITGESGSGKSTLINIISGLDTYEDGEIYINNDETSHYDENDWEAYRKNSISFIFQNFNLIESYSVLHNVEVSMIIQGINKKTRRKKALEIIEKVGLSNHVRHKASKLSGGEKQRLSIARALAKDTPIIVADEPTGNLDSESGKNILSLLNELSKDKLVIVVTHNYEQVEAYVTRKIRLFDGEIAEDKVIRKAGMENLKIESNNINDKISEWKRITSISLLNLIEQPKKTSLLLIVTLATIFFIFIIFGTFLSLDFTSKNDDGRIYNPYRERVIVARSDEQPLTEHDFKKFSKMLEVDTIVKDDLGLDVKLKARFSVRRNYYGDQGFISRELEYNEGDLIGRLPENPGDLVISAYIAPEDLEIVKSKLNEGIRTEISFGQGNNIKSIYTYFRIVGFHLSTEEVTRYYVTDGDYDFINENMKVSTIGYKLYHEFNNQTEYYEYKSILPDQTLSGNTIVHVGLMNPPYSGHVYLNGIEVSPIHSYNPQYESRNLYVSPEMYENLKFSENYQCSLFLNNYRDVNPVVNKLLQDDYHAFSPYLNQISKEDALILTATKVLATISIFLSILIIYFISYLIIKAIMATKTRDYTILKTIGIERKSIMQIVRFEIIAYFVISYVIFFICYLILGNIFQSIMNYYILSDYLIIGLINIAISLFISRRFIRLLNKKSIISNLVVE